MVMIPADHIGGQARSRVLINHIIKRFIMPMLETSVCAAVMHPVKLGQVAGVNGKLAIPIPCLCISGPKVSDLLLFAPQVGVTYQQEIKPFRPVPPRLIPVPAIILMRVARSITPFLVPQSNTFSREIIQPIATISSPMTAAAAARDFSRESTLAGMSLVFSQ